MRIGHGEVSVADRGPEDAGASAQKYVGKLRTCSEERPLAKPIDCESLAGHAVIGTHHRE